MEMFEALMVHKKLRSFSSASTKHAVVKLHFKELQRGVQLPIVNTWCPTYVSVRNSQENKESHWP